MDEGDRVNVGEIEETATNDEATLDGIYPGWNPQIVKEDSIVEQLVHCPEKEMNGTGNSLGPCLLGVLRHGSCLEGSVLVITPYILVLPPGEEEPSVLGLVGPRPS